VLARFALDHDKDFTFTTITINYNYAAAPHRDINHEDGKARIIALGDFEGGELHIESMGDFDIHNSWLDFDGTMLHHTKPFTGTRYSLVYFTHVACRTEVGRSLKNTLEMIGVPWPYLPDEIHTSTPHEHPNSSHNSVTPDDDTHATNTTTQNDYPGLYLCLPLKKRHQYEEFLLSEVTSLLDTSQMLFQNLPVEYRPLSVTPLLSPMLFPDRDISILRSDPCVLSIAPPVLPTHTHHRATQTHEQQPLPHPAVFSAQFLASRSVSFLVYEIISSSPTLSTLLPSSSPSSSSPSPSLNSNWTLPSTFSIEIFAYGRKMSTRQKRRVLMDSGLSRPSESLMRRGGEDDTQETSLTSIPHTQQQTQTESQSPHTQLAIVLVYDPRERDKDGADGVLHRAFLCQYVPNMHNCTRQAARTLRVHNDENPSITHSLAPPSTLPDSLVEKNTDTTTTTLSQTPHTTTEEDPSHGIQPRTNRYSSSSSSSTALRQPLSRILCNLARVVPGSLCLDPFCGSGCLVREITSLGGVCLASDVFRQDAFSSTPTSSIHHQQQHQYQHDPTLLLPSPLSLPLPLISGNFSQANIYHAMYRSCGQFDAIICDPPYGRREVHVDRLGVDSADHDSNEQRALSHFAVLTPLIGLASGLLRVGGRLVFLFLK
jgi:16S rRNA G966 N2-methylase RsmD